ncbi:hypothetical protein WJ803_01845 [Pseudomonas veronii]|uniref:hypothetical protein n=1 Tax=Pseudomonas veronii TaxID=76761 RepID=UPI003D81622E
MTDHTELKTAIEYILNQGALEREFIEDADALDAAWAVYEALGPTDILALIADIEDARNGMKHSCAIRLKKRIELLETQRDQLIADNERLTKAVGLQVIRRFVGDDDQKNIDELVAAGIQVDKELIVQLKAENERLAAKVEQVRSRSVSLDHSPGGVIPNALDAWGRVVPQHLPYDFSGNPGASATQYCNGWNDAGGYWKAHCVDIQAERDQLRAEVAGLRTGYEAYERVNAELKAEVGALRRDKSEPCDGCFMADAEVLRKDAGRYRWLRRAGNTKAIALVAEHCLDALDEAIDAALGQGEKS